MKRSSPKFNDKESAVLLAMYDAENGTYTSYTLARELNPTVEMSTPAAVAAFTQTRDATEQLIARGLVRGERLKGADGIYFNKLKLTAKGDQAAIQERGAVERRKAMNAIMEDLNTDGEK
ncbi:MAG: hypothetical protein WCC98_16770 [Candidatus Acidiferrales bacterium]